MTSSSRREFLGRLALAPQLAKTSGRPNIVFILTDDQRFDSFAAAGHPYVKTPHIDRIAHEGARFSNAFVTTSLCSPSRASFLTGQYAHLHGVKNNVADLNDTVAETFPKTLRQSGYDTGFFGKWHMGYDRDGPRPGFNRWVSFKGQGTYVDPTLNIDGESKRVPGYLTDLLTDQAVAWIRAKRDRPFLAYISHKAVHTPLIPSPRHARLYEGESNRRPASFDESYEKKPAWVKARRKDKTGVDGGLGGVGSLDEFIRRYHCVLSAVDESVGRVLQALEETGQLDNTVLVFAGDNGFFLGEHGFINKRAMYDESIRIPLLMRYPRLIRPKTVVDQMVLNIDLAPTLLDLAGAHRPDGAPPIQGRSWKPLLDGSAKEWRRSWLYEYFFEPGFAATPTMQGVRTERWKYVRYPNVRDSDELYDLQSDPGEMRNLAGEPSAKFQLEVMRTELYRLLQETLGT